ncbi:MAG: DUF2281 domain-containing protein [Candidatus Hydrogenedentes bacterium]|nr:DUF2281 domain-containing protein [Candidatus Hydrogenedentota bacterium]
MKSVEQIQQQLSELPLEKQNEVLDFISFLRHQATTEQLVPGKRTLHQHPAFGSWRGRNIDSLKYQEVLRSEWERA